MIFFSWIGKNDVEGLVSPQKNGTGSIVSALKAYGRLFDKVYLLNSYQLAGLKNILQETKEPYKSLQHFNKEFVENLKELTSANIEVINVSLSSPIDYAEIYQKTVEILRRLRKVHTGDNADFYYNLTSGTPAMSAIWLLIGKAIYPGKFIQTSEYKGKNANIIDIPFDIWTDYLPEAIQHRYLFKEEQKSVKSFEHIVTNSQIVNNLIKTAGFIAKDNCSILISGETGTGKELFAQAIHNASFRSNGKFVTINCAAIPNELLESELFGYDKGAFTGANKDKPGLFEAAHNGTMFLDEIGDLPLQLQVKLLRVLQEGKIRRLGAIEDINVDVRVISATNKNLLKEVDSGGFREDLYYRIAQFSLDLPPLRERKKDIQLLADVFLEELNTFSKNDKTQGFSVKHLTSKARKVLAGNPWRGNIRELKLIIKRAYLLANMFSKEIDDAIVLDSIINHVQKHQAEFDVQLPVIFDEIVDELEEKLVRKAWEESHGKVTKAAELLGFTNYQRYQLLLKKFGKKLTTKHD